MKKTLDTSEAAQPVPVNVTIPVVNNSTPGAKMIKVVILTKQSMFERLKTAFDQIGITGMTVTQVLDRGIGIATLPKVKVEVVINKIPVQTVVDTVKEALYTGKIGDGKMFIYDVENVIP